MSLCETRRNGAPWAVAWVSCLRASALVRTLLGKNETPVSLAMARRWAARSTQPSFCKLMAKVREAHSRQPFDVHLSDTRYGGWDMHSLQALHSSHVPGRRGCAAEAGAGPVTPVSVRGLASARGGVLLLLDEGCCLSRGEGCGVVGVGTGHAPVSCDAQLES